MHELEGRRELGAQITDDALAQLERRGQGLGTLVIVLGILSLIGLIGVVARLLGVGEGRTAWGYYAATFAFLLSTVQAAPIISVMLRLAKADWRRPLTRTVDLLSLAGIVTTLMFLPLPFVLPPLEGRSNIWFDWPLGAPGFYDFLTMLLLALAGLAILFVTSIPDLAVLRDRLPNGASSWRGRLALGWQGTRRQWQVLQTGLVVLGALYIITYVFTHLLISTDFSMSLIPGWVSAIFPAYHAVTGLEGGIATVLVTLYLMRRFGGLQDYLGLDQFWGLAKLFLALGLFWFYFWWSDFLTLWYGRTPREQMVLQLLVIGPYWVAFGLTISLAFLTPFLSLIWNRVRVSITGPTVVAVAVLIGLFFDRIRLYVSAFSIEHVTGHELEALPPTHFPDLADLAIMVGAPALVALVFVLGLRLLPAVSLWEVKEGLLLRATRRYLRSEVTIIGKPR